VGATYPPEHPTTVTAAAERKRKRRTMSPPCSPPLVVSREPRQQAAQRPSRARARAARRLNHLTRRAVTIGSEASTRRARVERKRRSTSPLRPPWQLSHVVLTGGDASAAGGGVT
jgi:hypothetical protein